MTVASEEKRIRRWVEQLRPFGRGRTYTLALRLRILGYIELAKATGMGERECCKSIGVSPTSIAAWRRADRQAVMPEVSEQPAVPLEFSVEPVSKALVAVEVTPSPVQLGGGLSLLTPRGFRIEGLSLEQAFALLREFL